MPTSQHLDADGETLSALFDGELPADAARFATDLFGMNAPLAEVEEGLREIVGLRERDGAVEIGWHLRRFVCQKTAGENR